MSATQAKTTTATTATTTAKRNVQVFLDDERGGVFTFGPLLVLDWRHTSDATIIEMADVAVDAIVKEVGAGRRVGYLHRVGTDSPIGRATPGVRTAALDHFERFDHVVAAAAVALEITGFAASVLRSATAGVLMARATKIPIKVYDDVPRCLTWLATMPMAPIDVDATTEALAAVGMTPL